MTEPARRGLLDRIASAYGDVRGSVVDLLAARPTEPTLLSILMFAAFLHLVGATLGLTAESVEISATDPATAAEQFQARFVSEVYGAILLFPIGAYIASALATGFARLGGGVGGFYHGRVAIFWAAVLTAPVAILARAIDGFAHGSAAPEWAPDAAEIITLALWAYAAYLVVACVAGAFKFPSTRRVLGAVAAAAMALLLIAYAARVALAAM